MKIVVIIQARMGSTRLPGKVMMPVLGKPLLLHQVERVRRCTSVDEIIIATTTLGDDDIIEQLCQKNGIAIFRGDENDVLSRFMGAARATGADAIVRLTGDCPLADPDVIDNVVGELGDYDYVSNVLERTYPRGMDVEVVSAGALKRIEEKAKTASEKEHVTLYIRHHPTEFKTKNVGARENFPNYRLTVDTQEDFDFIKLIFESLYPIKNDFRMKEIMNLLKKHPEWCKMNAHIEQKRPH